MFTDALAVGLLFDYKCHLYMCVLLPLAFTADFIVSKIHRSHRIQDLENSESRCAVCKRGQISRLVPIIVESGEGPILIGFEYDDDATK